MHFKLRTLLLISIIAYLANCRADASNSCSGIFRPTAISSSLSTSEWGHQFNALIESYGTTYRLWLDNKMTYTEFKRSTENGFYPALKAHFEQAGIKVVRQEYNWNGFKILPEGSHPLNQLSAGLKKRGIGLMFSPTMTHHKSLGMYDGNNIHIDIQTIAEGKVSFVAAHEIRHAYDHLRSKSFQYERLFQTTLTSTKTMIIPGMSKKEAYRESYSFDEILAHRQSASLLLRELTRLSAAGKENPDLHNNLKSHGTRIKAFVEAWLSSAEGLKEALRLGAVKFKRPIDENGEALSRFSFVITAPGFFKKFQWNKTIELQEGLLMSFEVTEAEALLLKTDQQMTDFAIRGIRSLTTEMQALRATASDLEVAMERFDGKDTTEAEKVLSDFYGIIAERREAMNIK